MFAYLPNQVLFIFSLLVIFLFLCFIAAYDMKAKFAKINESKRNLLAIFSEYNKTEKSKLSIFSFISQRSKFRDGKILYTHSKCDKF